MPNRVLDEAQRLVAMEIVAGVADRIHQLAAGDEALVFAYTRKVSKQLVYLERASPSKRKRLKKRVWKAQNQNCPECLKELDLKYSVADRVDAMKGYVVDNIEVIHAQCDKLRQERKAFL